MIDTIKKMDESIETLQQEIKERQTIINNLNKSKDDLCKISNACPLCYGKGEIYQPCNDGGDPYHKSSDDWVNCPRCNGNGKY